MLPHFRCRYTSRSPLPHVEPGTDAVSVAAPVGRAPNPRPPQAAPPVPALKHEVGEARGFKLGICAMMADRQVGGAVDVAFGVWGLRLLCADSQAKSRRSLRGPPGEARGTLRMAQYLAVPCLCSHRYRKQMSERKGGPTLLKIKRRKRSTRG